MRGLHYLHVGTESHHPGGEINGSELAFGVSWGHIDNESLDVSPGDFIELLGKDPMVLAFDKFRPDIADVFQEGTLDDFLGIKVLQTILQQQDLAHRIDGNMS